MRAMTWLACVIVLAGCSHGPQRVDNSVSLLKARYGHTAVSDGHRLYNLGGSNRVGLIDDVEVFDPATGKQWLLETKLLPRRYFAATYVGDSTVYLMGGNSRGPGNRSVGRYVEKLNLTTGYSEIVSRMPATAAFVSAVSVGTEILVFGGIEYKNDLEYGVSDVLAFNPQTKQWRTLKDLPVARATRAVVYQDAVYLVGGYDGQKAVTVFERYDPVSDSYQTLAPLPQKISAHSAVVVDDALLVFGDYKDQAVHYRYDFQTQHWEKLQLGYRPARHTAAAVVGDQVFVTGGNTEGQGSFLNYVQQFQF
ncbi:MAG: kelch repeat-containing protein [Rheinheimera sp.]|nr:kelch repeat-containing protein [Rheinheimera sp.]